MSTDVVIVCYSRCRHIPHEPAWTSGDYNEWREAIWAQNFDAAPEVCPGDCPGDEA